MEVYILRLRFGNGHWFVLNEYCINEARLQSFVYSIQEYHLEY
jgi:hypothetical protein